MRGVNVLGPIAVVSESGAEHVLGGRSGQLLAALTLNLGRVVSDDTLIDALWPADEQPPDPGGTLRTYVTRTRKVLAPIAVDRLAGGYRMDLDPADVDATMFEQRVIAGVAALRNGDPPRCVSEMTAALSHWRGRPWMVVEGWPPADIDAARLEELHDQAEEFAVAARVVLGDVEAAAAELIGLTEKAPLREFRWELLIRAQALQGQQADALRTFQRARDQLVEDLGIEPSRRLRDLEAAILEQRPLSPLLESSSQDEDASTRAAPREVHNPDPLVGRSEDVALVDSLLASLPSHPARMLVITGEPGIGKSRLLDEARVLADRHRLSVHRGVCFEEENNGAYRPVTEIIRSLVAQFPPTGTDRAMLGVLLPELRTGDSLVPTGDDRQFLLFDAAARLFSLAAEKGGVVIVDDVHWADSASIDLLSHCLRHTADGHLMVVVAFRQHEVAADSALTAWLARAGRLVDVSRIDLEGLGPAEVADLVRRRGGVADESVVEALTDLTGGNPLFLRELSVALSGEPRPIGQLVGELPSGLVDVLNHRLSAVGPDGQPLLRRVSLLPAGAPIELLSATLPVEQEILVDQLDSLTNGGILRERSDDGEVVYSFSHELLRVAMHDGLSLARRAALHHSFALAADELASRDRQRWLGSAAFHWFEAGRAADPRRAATTNEEAGEIAFGRTAFADAERCFERALTALGWQGEDGRVAPLHLRAAESAHRAGDVRAGRKHAEEAFDSASSDGDVVTAARAAIVHGGTRSTYGVFNPSTTRLLRAADGLTLDRPDLVGLRASVLARLAQEVNHAGAIEESRRMSAVAVDLARDVDDDRVAASVFRERVWTLNHPDWLEERERDIEVMLERAVRVGDPELELEARVWRASARLERGDILAFDAELAELERLRRRCPIPSLLVRVATLRCTSASLRGDFDVAMERAQDAHELGRRVEPDNAEQVLQAQMIAPLREQGLLAAALPLIQEMAEEYREIPGWRCVLAFVLCEAGEEDAAAREVEGLRAAGFASIRRDLAWSAAVSYLAETVVTLSDTAAAAEIEPLLAPFTGRNASLWDISSNGAVDHYLGRLHLLLGDAERAVSFLRRAVEQNISSDHRPAALRSCTNLVRARLRTPGFDPAVAGLELDAVIDEATSRGWTVVATEAESTRSLV